jgi:tRNA (guanine-N7-)-methyltransferase
MDKPRLLPLDDSPFWVEPEDICARLDWSAVFPVERPIEIDLGAGDGGFIAALAQQRPEMNFLAVERLLGRARKIARKAAREKLDNLKVLRLESAYVVEYLLPPGSVSVIHLMFPDPWPKRRHWGNRIIQPEFMTAVATALKTGGEFRFTTDHEEYFNLGSLIIDGCADLSRAPLWKFENDPPTDFQKGFEAEGRKTYRARWSKVAIGD